MNVDNGTTGVYQRMALNVWLISCLLAPVGTAQVPPTSERGSFTPAVVAGAVCRSFDPWQYQEELRLLQLATSESLNDLGSDVSRTLGRRYGNRIHLPFPKGTLLVSVPGGLEFWDCEECGDVAGAGELVADFAKQWAPRAGELRPNYEVDVENVSDNTWKVSYRNLTWLPEFEAASAAEFKVTGRRQKVKWAVSRRPGRTIWFRYESGWLWSGTRESLLRASRLTQLLGSQWNSDHDLQPLIRVWFTPQAIPSQLKSLVESQMLAIMWTQKQSRDLLKDHANQKRALAKLIQINLLKVLLNQTELIAVNVDRSAAGFVLNGKVTPKRGSGFGKMLDSFVSITTRSWRVAHKRTGVRGFLQARIPAKVADILSGESLTRRQDVDISVSLAGVFRTITSSVVEVNCRSGQIAQLNLILDHLCRGVPKWLAESGVPVATVFSGQPEEQALGAVVSGLDANELAGMEMFQNVSEPESHSGGELQLQIDSDSIAAITGRAAETNGDQTRKWLTASAQWDRTGVVFRVRCPSVIARQLLLAAILQSDR